jgi:hypothetical protein
MKEELPPIVNNSQSSNTYDIPQSPNSPEFQPETRKEQKEMNKHRYLPGERLQMQLNKQAKRDKKKAARKACEPLKEDDVDRISKSMGRVMYAMV